MIWLTKNKKEMILFLYINTRPQWLRLRISKHIFNIPARNLSEPSACVFLSFFFCLPLPSTFSPYPPEWKACQLSSALFSYSPLLYLQNPPSTPFSLFSTHTPATCLLLFGKKKFQHFLCCYFNSLNYRLVFVIQYK